MIDSVILKINRKIQRDLLKRLGCKRKRFYFQKIISVLIISFLVLQIIAGVFLPIQKTQADPGWLSGYNYRKKITIQNAYVDSNLTNFPVYIDITNDSDIGSNALSTGYDIRFTQDDETTLLSYERAYFNISEGVATGHFWVKVPTVNSGSSTDIYIYYGKADATDGEDTYNVWTQDFITVWHLDESGDGTADEYANSTEDEHHGQGGESTSTKTPSQVDGVGGAGYKAQSFDGSDDYINVADHDDLDVFDGDFTVSLWVKTSDAADKAPLLGQYGTPTQNRWALRSKDGTTAGQLGAVMYIRGPAGGAERIKGATSIIGDDQWHYIAATGTGGGAADVGKMYQEGVNDTGLSDDVEAGNHPDRKLTFASNENGASATACLIDEVRISNIVRTADWIKFEYRNITEADNELTWGSEESAVASATISSAANQTFGVSNSATGIQTITITDTDPPTITAANDIRIKIPLTFNMTWDTSDTTANIAGTDWDHTGATSQDAEVTVSYEDSNQTVVIPVTINFEASDDITIYGLSFANFTAVSSTDNLELEVDNAGTTADYDDKTITIVAPTISSAANQSFTTSDSATAISTITITDATPATITAANDIRIKIPDDFNMIWDTSDSLANIGGTDWDHTPASAQDGEVSVTFEGTDNSQIVVIPVDLNFEGGDDITVYGLSFTDFSDASSADNLELVIAGAGGVTAATDDKTITITITPDISISVSQSSDDAEQNTSTGAVVITSTDLELAYDGHDQIVGMRFQNVTIPQGATIDSAYIEFECDAGTWTGDVYLEIRGEDIDNAPTFTTGTSNISLRTYTTASASWTITAQWTVDSKYQSSDISTVVKEIVDRGGWNSGNSMVFKIAAASGTNKREAEAYNGETAAAPLLVVNYTPAAGGAITISSAANQSFAVNQSATAISTITITDNATTATITAANDIRITIPATFNMTWDTSDAAANIAGTDWDHTGAASSGDTVTATFEDNNRTAVIPVTINFEAGDDVTVYGLSFANFTDVSSADNLELETDNSGTVADTDNKTITIVAPTISSAANQTFYVNDAATAIERITITDAAAATITATNDIRIKIPATFNMTWDQTDTTIDVASTLSDYSSYYYTNDLAQITGDCSSVTYNPLTDTLFFIINGTPTIYEFETDGSYLRTITMTGFIDTEGIDWMSGTSYAVTQERDPYDIIIITIDSETTSIAKSSGTVITPTMIVTSNLGMEGISYDSDNDWFYVVTEKHADGSNGGRVFKVEMDGTTTEFTTLATNLLAAGYKDLGDLSYDRVSGHLFLLSEESNIIIEAETDGTIVTTRAVDVGIFGQPEGLDFSPDGNSMFIAGEADDYQHLIRSLKISTTASYEDANKTLVIDVTEDFSAGDAITISELSFDNFSDTSSADNLELVISGSSGSTTAADDKTITILSPTTTIAASTSQPSYIYVPSQDTVLGSASIARNVTTSIVTAITLKENSGTIDADDDLENIELWLSSDDTWDTGDNQLGNTGNFDGADGELTFTETFDVTTTTQYLIARGDVKSEVTTGKTFELQFKTVSTTDTVSGAPLNISGTSTVASYWWNTDWLYRKKLTFDNSAQAENLASFPVMVKLTSSNFDFTKAQSSGQDLRFVDSDNSTELKHEIEYWDSSGQTAIIWVKVPQIDTSSATDFIYMYYDNTGASDDQNITDVWSNGFAAVYHFAEQSGYYQDSAGTNHANNQQVTSRNNTDANGLGYYPYFGGYTPSDYVGIPDATALQFGTSDFTILVRANAATETTLTDTDLIRKGSTNTADPDSWWKLEWGSGVTNQVQWEVRVNGTAKQAKSIFAPDNNWHDFWGTRDATGNVVEMFIDGSQVASVVGISGSVDPTTSTNTGIGSKDTYDDDHFDGYLDEVRISNTLRSDDWIAAQRDSLENDLITFGSETQGVPTAPSTCSSTRDSDTQLTITWTDNSSNETGFKIERKTEAGDWTQIDTDSASPYVDTTTSANHSYQYRVRAYNNAGNSDYSTASAIYTLTGTPTNLTATAVSTNSITLSVDSFPNDTASSSGYYFSRSGANSGWVQTNTWQDTGLSCGTSYTYTVKYRNGDAVPTDTISLTKSTNGCGGGGLPSGAYNPPSPPSPTSESPKGGFKVLINNDDKYTEEREIGLKLFAGRDTKRMTISRDPNFSLGADTGQITYQSSYDWDLCYRKPQCPEGTYTVYVKFYTQYGQASEIVSDTIILRKKKSIIEKIPEIIKEIPEKIKEIPEKIKEIIKPKPKPEEIPEEIITVPEEAPLTMQGKWQLLPSGSIREFVLAPLPKEIKELAEKFPDLGETLKKVGVTKITDIKKLKTVKLTLPGLTERVGLPTARIEPGKFALPKSVPIAELSAQAKQQIPTEIVFAKTGGELIDFNIVLSVAEKGEPEQRINTISGKPLQLVVKPDKPVKSVKGYVVFKSKKKELGSKNQELSLNSLLASMVFASPSFAKEYDPVEIEERLVLLEFEYTDPDDDGIYTAEIQAPIVEGEYEIITVMDFEDPALGTKEIRLITVVDPEGYVYEKDGEKETRIPGAIVSLFWLNPETKQYELWPAKEYQQENPQTTDIRGTYSFLVPEGYYYLKVEAPGYLVYDGKPFQVKEGSGVHFNIELKTKYWWLKVVDWKTILLIAIIILLLYNFYRDKIRTMKRSRVSEP